MNTPTPNDQMYEIAREHLALHDAQARQLSPREWSLLTIIVAFYEGARGLPQTIRDEWNEYTARHNL